MLPVGHECYKYVFSSYAVDDVPSIKTALANDDSLE